MERVILSLGSNLGDRRTNLARAVQALDRLYAVGKVSCVYETLSMLRDLQENYYNAVVVAYTDYDEYKILEDVKGIEKKLGRMPSARWKERLIDIDIIDYGSKILNTETLNLPHPDVCSRSFVLVPMREVLDDWHHPVSGASLDEMIYDLNDKLNIALVGELIWE